MVSSIQLAVGILELGILSLVLIGAYKGRRLDLTMHHRFMYSAVFLQSLLALGYMLPSALTYLSDITSAPLQNIDLVFHALLGLVTLSLSLFLTISFQINKRVTIERLKKMRPVMRTTVVMWVVTIALGFLVVFRRA